uniref:UDENN domain-containing protein n=1 Tax=Timema bartmani TaxID=61472 RepID=A0A7R9F7R1_9NEOP|nr:unnamed protein product [Timema bartmani]
MTASSENMKESMLGPILHVVVVGFHHKKGCQVEFSFPPLIPGSEPDSNTCPPGWKYLPTLALPDGSHNFEADTVYFHLPSLTNPKQTVYGISCFRQIPVEKLKNRTADITRGTVQKSVCVLSTLPLYGHIQVKMALITHAYFDEGDFSKVKLLHDTYHHLNSCLSEVDVSQLSPQLYVGLSARDFILQFRHKALLLFKLLLLERRLVFYRSPVHPLCVTILSLLSLHPGMIDHGLEESACVKPSRPMSPIPNFADVPDKVIPSATIAVDTQNQDAEKWEKLSPHSPTSEVVPTKTPLYENLTAVEERWIEVSAQCAPNLPGSDSISSLSVPAMRGINTSSTLNRDISVDTLCDTSVAQSNMATIALVPAEQCGVPLMLFTQVC